MRKILFILKRNWIKFGFETIVVTVGILGAFALESWIIMNGESGILATRISGFYNVRLLKNRVTRNEVDDFLYDSIKYLDFVT